MNRQLKLFEERGHLESDCFISGSPASPDNDEVEYSYYNDFEKVGRVAVEKAGVVPLFPGEPFLRLCEPPEMGWQVE